MNFTVQSDLTRHRAGIARDYLLLLIMAWVIFQGVFLIISCVHEGGHALACKAQGYQVLQWCPQCRPEPSMQCSTTTAIGTAAGTLANLTAWTAATILFAVWLLPHYRHRWMPLFACSFGWAVWCFGCISNVIEWATSVHSTSILLPDTARFVAITHIDPRWISPAPVLQPSS